MAKIKRDYAKNQGQVTPRSRGEDRYEPTEFSDYDYRYGRVRPVERQEIEDIYRTTQRLEQRRSDRSYSRIRDMENEFYAGVDPRRRVELADAGLIREDHTAMANLPRMAQHHEFPKSKYFTSPYLDDSWKD